MRRLGTTFTALGCLLCMLIIPALAAAAPLRATPKEINFHKKAVGGEYYKGTTIKNTGSTPVRVVVSSGLWDDFGFGLMPGSTCPVFDSGEIIPAGGSCQAVVRFSPTEFFAGTLQPGELIATATNPSTGALVEEFHIRVLGMGVLR